MIITGTRPTREQAAQALFVSGASAGDGLTAVQIRSRVAQTLALSNPEAIAAQVDRALYDDREQADQHMAWCRSEVTHVFGYQTAGSTR